MHARDFHGADGAAPEAGGAGQLIALAERIGRTVAVARALIVAGRTVDLAGIEDGVGMLCAKALDLPRDQARGTLAALIGLQAQLASLAAALRPPGDA